MQHTGGERITKGSPEETELKSWIGYLAKLSGPELTAALSYRQQEASGHGVAPRAVLRRLTHSQYDNTVRDLLKDTSSPSIQFPPEDFVNGLRISIGALDLASLTEAYSRAAERLAASAFRRGDSRGLIPCKPTSETDAACRAKFIQTFGRKAFRRPLSRKRSPGTRRFQGRKDIYRGAQAVIETMLQSPSFISGSKRPESKWKPYARAMKLSYFLWDTQPDDALLETPRRAS
jgi:hypothetical protein